MRLPDQRDPAHLPDPPGLVLPLDLPGLVLPPDLPDPGLRELPWGPAGPSTAISSSGAWLVVVFSLLSIKIDVEVEALADTSNPWFCAGKSAQVFTKFVMSTRT